MKVRCKMTCQSKTETYHADGPGFDIRLAPVMDGSEENKEFYKYTPGGELVLSTVNPKAAAVLCPGLSYYIDISYAPEPDSTE